MSIIMQNNDHSAENLIAIFQSLKRYSSKVIKETQGEVTLSLHDMTKILVWGEKNEESFFWHFCEYGMLEAIYQMTVHCENDSVRCKIIESLSIFLINLSKGQLDKKNLNFFLSNNRLNHFIMYPYHFEDEDIVDNYINLLKSLALRIQEFPLGLFTNGKYPYMPVLQRALSFYDHSDQMVRTSVHNIFLTVLSGKQTEVISLVTSFPYNVFYLCVCRQLNGLWEQLEEQMGQAVGGGAKEVSRVRNTFEEQKDILLFIDEVLSLEVTSLSTVMLNAFISTSLSKLVTWANRSLSYHLVYLVSQSIANPRLLALIADLFSLPSLPGITVFQPTTDYEGLTISSPDWIEQHLATLTDYKVYKEYTTNNNAILNYLFYKKGENYSQLEVNYQRLMTDTGILIEGIDVEYLDPPLFERSEAEDNWFYSEWLESLADREDKFSAQLVLKAVLKIKREPQPAVILFCIMNHLTRDCTPGFLMLTIHNITQMAIDETEIYQLILTFYRKLLHLILLEMGHSANLSLLLDVFHREYLLYREQDYGQLRDESAFQVLLPFPQSHFTSIYRQPRGSRETTEHLVKKFLVCKKYLGIQEKFDYLTTCGQVLSHSEVGQWVSLNDSAIRCVFQEQESVVMLQGDSITIGHPEGGMALIVWITTLEGVQMSQSGCEVSLGEEHKTQRLVFCSEEESGRALEQLGYLYRECERVQGAILSQYLIK